MLFKPDTLILQRLGKTKPPELWTKQPDLTSSFTSMPNDNHLLRRLFSYKKKQNSGDMLKLVSP